MMNQLRVGDGGEMDWIYNLHSSAHDPPIPIGQNIFGLEGREQAVKDRFAFERCMISEKDHLFSGPGHGYVQSMFVGDMP